MSSPPLLERWPNADERSLLRSSFARLIPQSDQAVVEFYDQLFAHHPDVRPLFPADLTDLHEKFMMMLAWFIEYLDRPDEAAVEAQKLGQRHRHYGAAAGHYGPVGGVLLGVLTQHAGLNEAEVAAWGNLYGLICELMLAGATGNS
ncbi:MAG: hypothetical protein JNJ45_10325 [Chthonomonas sp.]|nr:hypothetical protein [Chthonomonas sp.]